MLKVKDGYRSRAFGLAQILHRSSHTANVPCTTAAWQSHRHPRFHTLRFHNADHAQDVHIASTFISVHVPWRPCIHSCTSTVACLGTSSLRATTTTNQSRSPESLAITTQHVQTLLHTTLRLRTSWRTAREPMGALPRRPTTSKTTTCAKLGTGSTTTAPRYAFTDILQEGFNKHQTQTFTTILQRRTTTCLRTSQVSRPHRHRTNTCRGVDWQEQNGRVQGV